MRTLIALGVGAAAMYLLDPEQGRRRRALLREQLVHARRVVAERTSGKGRAAGAPLEPGNPSQTPEGAQHLGR